MRIKYIDALRGWAILLIIVMNISLMGESNYHWLIESLFAFGNKGIQLFFVISAFTLFLSYKNQKTEDVNTIRNFYLRRFFRIAPMYYLAFIYFFWQKCILNNNIYSFSSIIASLTFLNGLSPYWINGLVPGTHTIVIVMAFYVLLPLFVLKIKNLNQAFCFTFFAYLVAVFTRFFLRLNSPIENESLWCSFLYLNFINQLPCFGIGIIAYFIVIEKDRKFSPINYLAITLLFIGCIIWNFLIPKSYCYSIGFMIAIYSLSLKEFTFFVNPFTSFLGKISYSVFYIHFAIAFWMIKSGFADSLPFNSYVNFIIKLVVLLMITCPLAWLSYKYVENTTQKWGKQFINYLNLKNPIK
jgi:peptidoglycan/LPS O-acetylase OafA/YrhL